MTITTHTGAPTNDSEKARQAAVIAQTGTKVDGQDQVTRFDRYTAFVLGTDCRDIHPNGHITPDNAALCGTDRAVEAMSTFPDTIDPEAVESATTVEIRTFDRFWCGRDDHPFGHGTVQTARHGATKPKQARKASIKVVTGGSAQPAPNRTQAPKPAATTQPTTPNANKPASRKLRSGSEGTVNGQAATK